MSCNQRTGRRSFLKRSLGCVVGAAISNEVRAEEALFRFPQRTHLERVDRIPENLTRAWLGPEYWANRLQDWRLGGGRLECLAGKAGDEGRSVGLLTLDVSEPPKPVFLTVRTGTLEVGPRGGFSGFLIGIGRGQLDYRAAALAQKASGEGGGIFCVYESDGSVRFREHADEVNPLRYAELSSEQSKGFSRERTPAEDVELRLEIAPAGESGRYDLKFSAWEYPAGTFLSP